MAGIGLASVDGCKALWRRLYASVVIALAAFLGTIAMGIQTGTHYIVTATIAAPARDSPSSHGHSALVESLRQRLAQHLANPAALAEVWERSKSGASPGNGDVTVESLAVSVEAEGFAASDEEGLRLTLAYPRRELAASFLRELAQHIADIVQSDLNAAAHQRLTHAQAQTRLAEADLRAAKGRLDRFMRDYRATTHSPQGDVPIPQRESPDQAPEARSNTTMMMNSFLRNVAEKPTRAGTPCELACATPRETNELARGTVVLASASGPAGGPSDDGDSFWREFDRLEGNFRDAARSYERCVQAEQQAWLATFDVEVLGVRVEESKAEVKVGACELPPALGLMAAAIALIGGALTALLGWSDTAVLQSISQARDLLPIPVVGTISMVAFPSSEARLPKTRSLMPTLVGLAEWFLLFCVLIVVGNATVDADFRALLLANPLRAFQESILRFGNWIGF